MWFKGVTSAKNQKVTPLNAVLRVQAYKKILYFGAAERAGGKTEFARETSFRRRFFQPVRDSGGEGFFGDELSGADVVFGEPREEDLAGSVA